MCSLPSPKWGKVAPQGRMRDEPAEICPLTGSNSKPAPHPPSGGASGTFPQGGRLRLSKNACRGEHCSPVPVCLAKNRPGKSVAAASWRPALWPPRTLATTIKLPGCHCRGAASSTPRGGVKTPPYKANHERGCNGKPPGRACPAPTGHRLLSGISSVQTSPFVSVTRTTYFGSVTPSYSQPFTTSSL